MTKTERRPRRGVSGLPLALVEAARAAYDKKAEHIVILDLRKSEAFTDFFLICSGRSTRHVRAIVDAIEESLGKRAVSATHLEGYDRAEWVLADFFDFIVHVFTPETRAFYALERLWGSARHIVLNERGELDVAR